MRKRLRKKLRRGEYREYGFNLAWQFAADVADQEVESFWNDLIDLVERRGLILGGGGDQEGGGVFITKDAAPGTVPEDRAAVLSWVQEHEAVVKASAGAFVDAWAWTDSNAA